MTVTSPREFAARHPDGLFEQVAAAFNPHTLQIDEGTFGCESRLRLKEVDGLAMVELSYGAAVTISPEPFDDFYLIATTLSGGGTIQSAGTEAVYSPMQSLILSVEKVYAFRQSCNFKQRTIRVPSAFLHRLFSQWTGQPLESSLNFRLTPLAPALNRRWMEAIALLYGDGGNDPIPPISRARLMEYALASLIEGHPHGDSDRLRAGSPVLPRVVRLAEEFIRVHAGDPLTMADIAAAAGCSVRTLQACFRMFRETTPSRYLAEVRLERARDMLVKAAGETTVTDVALSNGFIHLGRFSAAFADRYGERPADLLRRKKLRPPLRYAARQTPVSESA